MTKWNKKKCIISFFFSTLFSTTWGLIDTRLITSSCRTLFSRNGTTATTRLELAPPTAYLNGRVMQTSIHSHFLFVAFLEILFNVLSVFDRNLARDLQAAPLSSTNWWFWRQHGCWSGLFSSRWGSVSFTYQCKVCGPIVPNSSPKHCAAGGAIFFQCFSQTELARLRFWYLEQTIFFENTH